MISEGDVLLFRFPQSDLGVGKLRPALVIKKIGGDFDDWLVCMISTQTRHQIRDLEVILNDATPNFTQSGLKKESLIRTSRLAVAESTVFSGRVGRLSTETFRDIRDRLAVWIRGGEPIKAG